MPLNILFQSNIPIAASGYGVTGGVLAQIFLRLGHKVNYFAFFGLEGGILPTSLTGLGYDILPRGASQWGEDIVWSHAQRCGSDLLITNVDVFVLRNYGSGQIPWLPICPVMEDPLQPGIAGALHGAINIATISKYSQRVLHEGGFPSMHIPLPVPTEHFVPLDKRRAKIALGFPEDSYVIGNVGMNRGNRKGHDILLRAFQQFLAEVPNAYLWIHTDTHQQDGLNLEQLALRLGLQNNVRFPSRYDAFLGKSQQWMVGLFNAFDLYVQPSRNEGQGMPVCEACSVGLPFIATDATALSELMENAECIPVQPYDKKWLQGEGYAYEISTDSLTEAMLEGYRKWGKGYISLQNRQLAIENFSIPEIGHKWQDLLFNVEKRIRFSPTVRPWTIKPKVVQVSTDVANCGIGAYTRALMASLEQATDQQLVEVRSLEEPSQIPQCDIVHWHFEPGISPSRSTLERIFTAIRNRGSQLILTFHAIDVKMINYLLEKKMISEVILHWPLAGMNVTDARVSILGGMGCPIYNPARSDDRDNIRARFGFKPQDIIISTFGFAAVGRGHFEIPLELAATIKSNPQLHLQLILPGNFLNEPGKMIVHDQLKRIVEAYDIRNQVHLVQDFLPDTEVLDRLWISDVGYLYIGMDTASSSSAIRFFISSRLPTVVTHSSHFSDVRMGVKRVESFSTTEFSMEILNLVHNYELRNRLMREMDVIYRQWNWPRFGEKIMSIYKKSQQ